MATITVTPGQTFASGDTVTSTKLNNLGNPVASLSSATIVNADVSASAAIAHSKLATITAGSVLLGNASAVPTATALSGDVTVNSSGITAIGAGVIVDADVSASAAIGLSKLATGALPTAITVASANIVDGTIVNADISGSAAIDISKLATSTTAALGVGSIELGHAADTTLSRAAAGRLAVEGVNVVTTSSTDTLTNKTLTSPVISTITNTGTLTLPTSTDTLVGRATTDTLTNKSIALGSNTVTGTKAQFDTAVTDDNFAYTGTANSFTANQTVTGTVTAQAAATQDAVVMQGRAGGTSSRSVTLTPASLTASRTLTLPDTTGTVVTTGDSGTVTSTMIADGTIALADLATAVANALVPVGAVEAFARSTAPSGWLAANGNTIGSASSGANNASADYSSLFAVLWDNWSNTDLPILDSTGAASTRGASAAADFSANKRLPLPNLSGIFVRGSGGPHTIGSSSYSATFGAKQEDQFESHTHYFNDYYQTTSAANVTRVATSGGNNSSGPISETGATLASTTNATGGTETNPANIALLYCIKF